MLLSFNWLKEFVPYTGTAEELGEMLTMLGLELEEVVHPFEGISGLVVGRAPSSRTTIRLASEAEDGWVTGVKSSSGITKIPVARPALLSVVLLKPRKPWITSPRLHALRSVVSIPNSGKATTLLYVINANMLFSIIPPPQSP